MHSYQKSTLANGARLLLVPAHDTEAVTVLVLFGVGSRYESRRLSGVSHFVEHMMFKGTKRRPTTKEIARALDSVGADYNAFTGKEYTGYYIKLNAEKTPLAVDLLEDMLFHSAFLEKECDRERHAIFEEINMYEDNPLMSAEDLLEEEVYGDTPLGWMISGTHETVGGLGRADLVAYRDRHYVPSNMVVAVAGKINDDVVSLVDNSFGRIPASRGWRRQYVGVKPRTGAPKFRIKRKATEQAQFVLGFPGYPNNHEKMAALKVLTVALGGGMSSRLFTEVRERRGLAYSVSAGSTSYHDTGNVAIQAGLNKEKIADGVKAIMVELNKVVAKGLGAEELNRAKEFLKGKTILSLENSSELAMFYAKQEILSEKIEAPAVKIDKVMKVAAGDVLSVAREVFRTSRLSAGVIGPFDDGDKFKKLLKIDHV
jgi:predicted Zn-dependent peptidase